MAAIPDPVAKIVLGSVGELERELIPFIEKIVHDAGSGSIDIAEHTAQNILDAVRTHLGKIESEVKRHSPQSGQ
jgi:hypothetical protein